MQLDLRAQGIEMSPVDGNGWYDFPVDAPNEIFMNGARLTKARWPNDDESQMLLFAKPATKASHGVDTTKYNGGNMPLMMIYPDAENRTNNWEFKKNDLLIGGAIAFAWAASELRVDELNTKEKWFTTSDKHVYGIDPEIVGWGPQYKIYFANVFEEIDKPGESYVDREKGILYFYPVGKVEGSEMVVSTLEKEMLKITNASHITFKFTDIIGHWAEKDINDMATKGIVSGVTATTFEPDRSITRAEFAALMARALKLSAGNTESVFADVANDAWYAKEVSAAAAAGLIVGYDGNFRPNDTITREEMAVVIMKAYAFLGKTASSGQIDKFADKDTISDWAVNYVDQAVSTGMISGMSADTFAPKENATRAQVTSLIKRLLSR